MKKQQKKNRSGKKIADEILYQIGGSVIFVLLLIAAVAICMVGWLTITSGKKELTGIQYSCQPADRISGAVHQERRTARRQSGN